MDVPMDDAETDEWVEEGSQPATKSAKSTSSSSHGGKVIIRIRFCS